MNTMIEVGRLIVKLAGRDAGLRGIIVDILDEQHVLIDGQVRRRKCNILHVEPLDKVVKISKKASHEDVVKVLKKEGIDVTEPKKKEKAKTERPRKVRKKKEVVTKEPEKKKTTTKTSKKSQKE